MNERYEKDLRELFISRGYNPVFGTIYQQQEIWLQWYRGNVDQFHEIQKKTVEGTNITVHKPSLQMAKKVCEDVTSLLFNEKVELIAGNKTAQQVLDKVLEDNNFYDEMVGFIELTGVYGTGVIVEYISNNQTKLNFLHGNKVIIIDYDNTTPKAIAVIQQFAKDKKIYRHIMYHTFRDGIYRIQHEMYSSKDESLGKPSSLEVLFNEQELKKMRHTHVEDNVEIVEYYIEYETSVPHFQIFKFAITNNYDVKSPLGISLFANSIGTLENIDEKYYSSRMDSINSRKRIFVDDESTKLQKVSDGTNVMYKKYFDQDETQFQVLKGLAGSDTPIVAFSPSYDSTQHDSAIQNELCYLSSKTMLGRNYYSFKDGVVGYQNEMNVIASNSDTFRNRQKNINRLKKVIINMMKSILFLESTVGNYNGNKNVTCDVSFDDDIITDDATILAKLRQDARDGLIPEYKYIMQAYSLSEEEAKGLLMEAEEEIDRKNKKIADTYE